jgi:formiminotetrahydrofolate cyclodeaminase
MKLTETSVVDFLAALRSPSPTPGGGSASALAGALGASLLAMVASMAGRRAAAEEDVDRLEAAGGRCTDVSARLTTLVDRDSEAYALVVASYKRPKSSDAEKTERSRRIQAALRAATDVPLDVMRECTAAAEAAIVVAAFGNPNAASDVGVGLELLGAGIRGAKLNVEINLGGIKDSGYADGTRREVAALMEECARSTAAARVGLETGRLL